MKYIICLLLVLVLTPKVEAFSGGFINYFHILELVKETLSEDTRQRSIKTKQAAVRVNEDNNKKQLSYFQEKYKAVKSRLNSLGIIIDAATFLSEVVPLVNSIKETQSKIVQMVTQNPEFALIAAQGEKLFIEKAVSVVRLYTGLSLSLGELNKMEVSDRKILLDFSIAELQELDGQAFLLAASLRQMVMTKVNLLSFAWVNQDKQLIEEILSNAKKL
ncbi:MAG: hypothetical protein ACK5M7_21470 [Draconibacterium sp.]